MQLGLPGRSLPVRREGKKNEDSHKVFKRQTYHLAISYNIYLQTKRGSDNELDPTLAAKKLRDNAMER
jgi:hypothetical protein